MAGWQRGIGEGFKDVAQIIMQYPELRMRAAAQALQQKQQNQAEEKEKFSQSMDLLSRSPEEGLTLNSAQASLLDPTVRAIYTKPETKPEFLESEAMPGTTAAAGQGVQQKPEQIPTGNVQTIPFEDVKQRAMAARMQATESGKNLRLQLAIEAKRQLADQANTLKQMWYSAQTDVDRARVAAQLKGVYEQMRWHDIQAQQGTEKFEGQKQHWGALEQIAQQNADSNTTRSNKTSAFDPMMFVDPEAWLAKQGTAQPSAAPQPTKKSRFTVVQE